MTATSWGLFNLQLWTCDQSSRGQQRFFSRSSTISMCSQEVYVQCCPASWLAPNDAFSELHDSRHGKEDLGLIASASDFATNLLPWGIVSVFLIRKIRETIFVSLQFQMQILSNHFANNCHCHCVSVAAFIYKQLRLFLSLLDETLQGHLNLKLS